MAAVCSTTLPERVEKDNTARFFLSWLAPKFDCMTDELATAISLFIGPKTWGVPREKLEETCIKYFTYLHEVRQGLELVSLRKVSNQG